MSNSAKFPQLLTGTTILIATNRTRAPSRELFYNIYPHSVINSYREALIDLGADIIELPLHDALILLSPDSQSGVSAIVNVCIAFNELECEGVIQAVAALSRIPCFPCRGDIAIISEEKIVCKHLAVASGFQIAPTYYNFGELVPDQRYVRKRVNSGDSKNIHIFSDVSNERSLSDAEFIEPFLRGVDIEIFCIMDPGRGEHVILASKAADWGEKDGFDEIHATEMKSSSDVYKPDTRGSIEWKSVSIGADVSEAVKKLGILLHNTFIFRIDGRVGPGVDLNLTIDLKHIIFLEVNAIPTIPGDAGWFSPALFNMAGLKVLDEQEYSPLSKEDLAIRLILAIWCKLYVQSKSAEGNNPVS